jgi:hypothetical protein
MYRDSTINLTWNAVHCPYTATLYEYFSVDVFTAVLKNMSHCRLLLQYYSPLRNYYQIGFANIFTDKTESVTFWHTNTSDTVQTKHRQWNGIHTHTVFVIAWKAIRPLVQDLYKVLITK